MGYFADLMAYQKAYALAFEIFNLTKKFPAEERYSLTDQIRRSSRSVCSNIAEAYRRRRYRDYFISKLCDADTENSETQVWLDFSRDCGYLAVETHARLSGINAEIGKLLWYMINNPDKFRGLQTPNC